MRRSDSNGHGTRARRRPPLRSATASAHAATRLLTTLLLTALLLTALASCAGPTRSSDAPTGPRGHGRPVAAGRTSTVLLGTWEAYGKDDVRNTLEFVEDGRARWVLGTPNGAVTVYVNYAVDETKRPMHIDLTGFTSGPLKGLAMYGILDMFGKDHFRVDFEMGKPTPDGAVVRPTSFGPDTMEYDRLPSR